GLYSVATQRPLAALASARSLISFAPADGLRPARIPSSHLARIRSLGACRVLGVRIPSEVLMSSTGVVLLAPPKFARRAMRNHIVIASHSPTLQPPPPSSSKIDT